MPCSFVNSIGAVYQDASRICANHLDCVILGVLSYAQLPGKQASQKIHQGVRARLVLTRVIRVGDEVVGKAEVPEMSLDARCGVHVR